MHAYVYPSRQEKVVSGAFAFGMHLVFVVLLAFGVTWQKRIEPQANIVDLWANLPTPAPPKVEPPPPQPELKLEVKLPEPPPKPVAKPEIAKPDIALKEKAEKERRALEEKQKEARKLAEAKKREADDKAAEKLRQAKEAEAKAKAEQEQQEALQKLANQQAAAQARLRNEYIERIRTRIKGFTRIPPNLQGNPEVEVDVIQIPGGEVISVKLRRSSGVSAYDDAVEKAILKASPLPTPPKPELFERELNLRFRPQS